MASLTFVVLTHNSAAHLERCLRSLEFAGQNVLVIDDESSDNSRAIAKSFKAKIVVHPVNGDFAAQRNHALSHVTTDWAFFIDSDEWLPQGIKTDLHKLLDNPQISGYSFSRKDWFCDRWLKAGETASARFVRLARVGAGTWSRSVHEVWEIDGQVESASFSILHYPHPTFSGLLAKLDYYSSLEAIARAESYTQFRTIVEMLSFPLGKAVHSLIFKKAYTDGIPGLIFIFAMSLHSLLVRIKIFEIQRNA